jgi:hypothetical protein
MHQKQKPTRRPLEAKATMRDVITDEDFKPNVETYGGNKQRAFAVTAMALVELGTAESGHRTRNADQLHVASTLDDFIAAKTQFDAGDYHPSSTKDLKRDMIAFNHAVSQLIDNDPGAKYNEVLSYLNDLYRSIRPRETDARYDYVNTKFSETLKGMTQEIIAEQLAGYLGYEVLGDVSPEEEMRGIDRYFGIDGEWEGVDVKASSRKANEARAKDRRGRYIVATDIPDDVIGCNFRLNSEDVPRYAKLFQGEIDREYSRVSQLRGNKAQSVSVRA